MKTLTLQQLLAILAQISKGHSSFKKKLAAYSRPLRRLYLLESEPNNTITSSSEVYKFVFELDDYKDHQLTTLRTQLREALTDFIKLRMLEESAIGQNLIADLYEKYGHHEWANKTSKKALQLKEREPEQQRWLSSFQAHMALHLGGAKGHLKKAQQDLLFFFFVSFLKLSIEDLTIFRIEDKESPINEKTLQQIEQVFKLLPVSKPPIINIQTKAVEYYINQDFERYQAFKIAFLQQVDLIESDKKHLLIFLLNAIALYPNPSEKITREYLPIYKEAIQKELFSYDEDLGIRTVCNILLASDLQNDYELIQLASNKLIPLLSEKNERVWCSLLADIYLSFGSKNYSHALEKIKQLDNENCRFFDVTFRKNILKLKCCYDSSSSCAEAYIKIGEAKRNFEKLLKRNFENQNIDSLTRLRCTNFINFLMMVCNTHNKKYTKTYLLEKLASYKEGITETKWLKEKIAERPF